MKPLFALLTALVLPALAPLTALASGGEYDLHGAELSIFWVIPFACMLLSIAIGPLALPHFWHHHFGKVAVFWGLAFLVPCAMVYGAGLATYQLIHVLLMEYIPFIILLFTLFTVAGGVRLKGQLVGTPLVNAGLLLLGTVLASWMGTTGAAMLLIRPLLRANEHRRYRMHSVVFFIFLVANIGGSLSPLGDPPLFLGFLKGVDFFWTTIHLFSKTVLLSVILLGVYFILDTVLYKKEGQPKPPASVAGNEKLGLDGTINLLLLLGVIATVLMSGIWKTDAGFTVFGTHVELPNLARDLILLGLAGLSLRLTTKECRKLNNFTWEPIAEVAKLFIGIFVSMIPAIAILRAGQDGAL
ncbi:MAG: sodium:proton antiporter, partial [Bilophila sp.]